MADYTVTAGHGGGDPGAVAGEYTEAALMLGLRDLVAERLRERGHAVKCDGARGQNLSLREAIPLIRGSVCAVELHTNAAANPAAKGVEVISLPMHKRRAQGLAKAIAGVLASPVRGDGGWIDQSQSARGRLGYVNAGGLIVETFFISNPDERSKYLTRARDLARVIADYLEAL